ncbi:ABC transporter transmembrane domain-containing protein [Shewanella sp. CG12_big_fil_rev_8_21_14_0_65_47_15]|uniref:ABC transporter ATP-binding protein n=1 Tax=Shewanella sp. CG12_big_fil_rev_8_21_14_0_65_47_15 TaxID=1975537 RepID=UPI000CC8220E|nr:ABC transporter transmembrane domain-containing protein [Shewanella sp. CG12_big_fil_rev_8_21_14_0_65_47_15]PIW61587.1 MAG: ABC transporter permease [Shewanella sp. CG12_big_fil_rev_8_21_14_0_65_47_15]
MNLETRKLHRLRLSLIRPYIYRLLLGFLVMLVTVIIQLSFPKAVAYFIDNSAQAQQGSWLTWVALLMILVFLIHAAATSLRYYLFESAGILIVTRLRQALYGAIIGQGIGFFDRNNVGNLSNRLSADVEILKDTLTMALAIALRSLLTCIGGAVLLLMLSPGLSLLMLIVVPLSILAARQAGKMVGSRSKLVQDNLADCNHIAQESLTNIRLMHAFGQQDGAKQRYRTATGKTQDLALGNTRIFAGFQGVTSFIQYMALLVTLWFGGQMVLEGKLSIGELTSFILYAAMVAMSASGVSWFWGEWMKAVGATERVFELLSLPPQIPEGSGGADLPQLKGEIHFENVAFAYPARPENQALRGFTLSVAAGEKIALVGASGAGKSTIASLILGFYKPDAGRLKFDGVDADTLSLHAIRRNIAIVEQEPSLFSGSILENIQYALSDRLATAEEVIQAAKHANAHEFICKLPSGYDTQLGDRGVQLSGGQKQRIAIARAILRDANILILDEATSALDAHNEYLVQQGLENLMRGRTTIMITHRFSTISRAQRIVVMDQGEISQIGSHDSLILNKNGIYCRLMQKQINDLESAVSIPA